MKTIRFLLLALAVFAAPLLSVHAGGPPHECCYYNGVVVRTIVPPSATPNEGRDNLYSFASGTPDQMPVVGVIPGAPGYHGGLWAVHEVTWNVAPSLLTSEAAVLAAAATGDITITRLPEADFRCPIQP